MKTPSSTSGTGRATTMSVVSVFLCWVQKGCSVGRNRGVWWGQGRGTLHISPRGAASPESPSCTTKGDEKWPHSASALQCTDEIREPHWRGAWCLGPWLSGGIINKIDASNGSKKDHGATHYQGLKLLIIRFSAAVTRCTHPNHGAPHRFFLPWLIRGHKQARPASRLEAKSSSCIKYLLKLIRTQCTIKSLSSQWNALGYGYFSPWILSKKNSQALREYWKNYTGVEEGECGIPDWEEGGGLEQLQSDSNAGMRGI